MSELAQKIEALLFYKNEPLSQKKLASILKVGEEEIQSPLEELKKNSAERGIVLVQKEDEVMLGTNPKYSEMIENLQKDELQKDLSKASLETLSIVLYKNGATRSEIDFIRGVNSSFILRALILRGLVEKMSDPQDSRRIIYKPTFSLLSFMGVVRVEDLPDYENMLNKIDGGLGSIESVESTT